MALCFARRSVTSLRLATATPALALSTRTLHTTRISMSQAHKDGSTVWNEADGRFKRQVSSFRSNLTPSAEGGEFPAEVGRYHLVVAYACPWAHRTLIVRALKGFDKVDKLLPFSAVDSFLGPEGWTFVPYPDSITEGAKSAPGTGNKVPGHEDKKRIRELYLTAEPSYDARCTVPIVWDTKKNTIVSNESSEIIRSFNNAFNEFIGDKEKQLDFYPEKLRGEIDELNEWVYSFINNGVYRCGFASTQEAYEEAVGPLFESLDRLEKILSDGRDYLIGGQLTEADIRLYTTIVRFDPVYVGHFKCNLGTIRANYPHLKRWLAHLYAMPAFKDTTDFDSIKKHYYQSHKQINPTRIVPVGPVPHIELDL